jgi:RES domain
MGTIRSGQNNKQSPISKRRTSLARRSRHLDKYRRDNRAARTAFHHFAENYKKVTVASSFFLRLKSSDALRVRGSIFDLEFVQRLERAKFLGSLSGRITQPVMPDDEPFEYPATQAIADLLATESSVPVDGIIFPSVQVARDALNVVLFHKAARVEAMDIPEGIEIRARTGQSPEGWEDDYSVIEEVRPPAKDEGKDKSFGNRGFSRVANTSERLLVSGFPTAVSAF